jgi:hypothetical protein
MASIGGANAFLTGELGCSIDAERMRWAVLAIRSLAPAVEDIIRG